MNNQPRQPSLFPDTPSGISLCEFNARIADCVNRQPQLTDEWVIAETSDVRVKANGHCYLKLVEKGPDGNTVTAQADAVIWNREFHQLKVKFEQGTGAAFNTGMQVMVKVTASFHTQYGLKLTITDIDPRFTLGDMARKRLEIIKRLQSDGVIDNNKQLPWPALTQRIAVISAPGAAGYGDFINQLQNNAYGLKFYTCLFRATMQGNQTVPTVLRALNAIKRQADLFQCVVIIRGGGASVDLNSFDDYNLALEVAQFPLPVIVGIGHERDETVLDHVGAVRVKTPTAAAEHLIKLGADQLALLEQLKTQMETNLQHLLTHARERLTYLSQAVVTQPLTRCQQERIKLNQLANDIHRLSSNHIMQRQHRISEHRQAIVNLVNQRLTLSHDRLTHLTKVVELLSPRNVLNRGYSLVRHHGQYITQASQVKPGDLVTVHLKEGHFKSTVTE